MEREGGREGEREGVARERRREGYERESRKERGEGREERRHRMELLLGKAPCITIP